MAGATLQALHPDREILLGVGISSPVVTQRWHGVPYGDHPVDAGARVRHAAAGLPLGREGRLRRRLLLREGLPARGEARRAAAEDRGRRAQPRDAAPGRRAGRRRAAQLPAGVARAVVGRAGPQGRRRRRLRLRPRRRSASGRRASSWPAATCSPTPSSTPTPATSNGPASPTRSPPSARPTPPATARCGGRGRVRPHGRRHRRDGRRGHGARPRCAAYVDAGVDVPVLMPLPWGKDRRGSAEQAIRAGLGRG